MKPPVAAYGAWANKTSANAYADVGILETSAYRTKHFVFVGATNTMSVTIFGSIDGGTTYPLTAEAEFTVAAGATVTKTITVPYTHLKVQVKSTVGGAHGVLTSRWFQSQW